MCSVLGPRFQIEPKQLTKTVRIYLYICNNTVFVIVKLWIVEASLNTNSKYSPHYWRLTCTAPDHIYPYCYVPELICRSYKFSHKQHTVRQDANGSRKMSGEEIQHVYKESEGQQMYAGRVSDHITIQPYNHTGCSGSKRVLQGHLWIIATQRSEDGWHRSKQALLFTAAMLQMVSSFCSLSPRLH